jgi:hypothetical protein
VAAQGGALRLVPPSTTTAPRCSRSPRRCGAGALYILGRHIYSLGYTSSKGAEARAPGAALLDVALVVNFGLAVYGGWSLSGAGASLAALLGGK